MSFSIKYEDYRQLLYILNNWGVVSSIISSGQNPTDILPIPENYYSVKRH